MANLNSLDRAHNLADIASRILAANIIANSAGHQRSPATTPRDSDIAEAVLVAEKIMSMSLLAAPGQGRDMERLKEIASQPWDVRVG